MVNHLPPPWPGAGPAWAGTEPRRNKTRFPRRPGPKRKKRKDTKLGRWRDVQGGFSCHMQSWGWKNFPSRRHQLPTISFPGVIGWPHHDLTSSPGALRISHQPRSFQKGWLQALSSHLWPEEAARWWGQGKEQEEPWLFAVSPRVAPFQRTWWENADVCKSQWEDVGEGSVSNSQKFQREGHQRYDSILRSQVLPWPGIHPASPRAFSAERIWHIFLAVHGVARSRTWLSNFTFTFYFHALEKEMATHSSVLAWRIPGTGEPGGLPFMGLHRVRHNWSDLA